MDIHLGKMYLDQVEELALGEIEKIKTKFGEKAMLPDWTKTVIKWAYVDGYIRGLDVFLTYMESEELKDRRAMASAIYLDSENKIKRFIKKLKEGINNFEW